MRFSDWEPVYEAVLADFGYDRGADERARDILADLLPGPGYDPARLDIQGATVAVAGGADRLTQDRGPRARPRGGRCCRGLRRGNPTP
jgi:Uncharacterized Rossmann fold enzyme